MIFNPNSGSGGGVKLPVLTTPADPDKVLEGYEIIAEDGSVQTGTIQTVGIPNPTIEFDESTGGVMASVTAGPGYLDTEMTQTTTFDIPIVDIATPTVSINENGLVTATQLQTKGYIKETGSASATMQLQVRTDTDINVDGDGLITAPAGYYPQAATMQLEVRTENDLTVNDDGTVTASAGYYPNDVSVVAGGEPTIAVSTAGLITATSGNKQKTHQITSADIPTLTPGNIRSGVNIAGVVGTVTGGVVTCVTVTTGVAYAVVTARCGTTTQTATCNYQGVAYVYLTMAGTWTFSAQHAQSGAYSTADASVEIKTDYPITLTVGSGSTTVTAGYETATLNMAYRPYINRLDYATYYGFINTMCTTVKYGTADKDAMFVFVSGEMTNGKPIANTYGADGSNFKARFDMYYPRGLTGKSYVYTMNYDRGASQYGRVSGRWGGAAAQLRYTGGVVIGVFTGGYSPCPYEGGYMDNVDIYVPLSNSSFAICGSYEARGKNTTYAPASSSNDMKANLSTKRAWHAASGYHSEVPYVLIAGGQTSASGVTAVVETLTVSTPTSAANIKITKGTASNLSVARSHLAGICHTNDYILFAGGKNSSGTPVANVDAYSSSRAKSTPTALSVARYNLAAAICDDTYVLFAGGVSGNGVSNVIDAYNLSRTRTTPVTLSTARHDLAGLTVGEYAVFAGGRTSISSGASDVIDMIGKNLVRSVASLTYARYGCRGCGELSSQIKAYEGFIFGGFSASGTYLGYYEEITMPI